MQPIPLVLEIPGFTVPAALTIPDGDVHGAVLIVPGSLYSNVDGDYPSWNSFPRVYAGLAEGLARRGLASLRFAKLGPGTGSEMNDPALAATSRTWAGRERTAGLALQLLRHQLAGRGLADVKVVLAGHSEGSVVVSLLGHHGADVDGIVLLSGPSLGILGIMQEQNRRWPGVTPEQLAVLDEVIDIIRRGEPITDDVKERAKGSMGAGALVNFPPEGIAYMRDVDATDPVTAIATYEKPVLIVQGGADFSVPVHHAEALRAGRGGRPTTYACFPELSHMYKDVPAGTPMQENFGFPGPTDPRVDEAIAAFIASLP
jgi:alpha-beta hydrolase superfamily lysophospholipase